MGDLQKLRIKLANRRNKYLTKKEKTEDLHRKISLGAKAKSLAETINTINGMIRKSNKSKEHI